MPGKRSQEGKRKRELRRLEYEREQALIKQQQIAKDYLLTHCRIARKNEEYEVTEKVLTCTPESLLLALSSEVTNPDHIIINPDDFPEGLVLNRGELLFDVNVP